MHFSPANVSILFGLGMDYLFCGFCVIYFDTLLLPVPVMCYLDLCCAFEHTESLVQFEVKPQCSLMITIVCSWSFVIFSFQKLLHLIQYC